MVRIVPVFVDCSIRFELAPSGDGANDAESLALDVDVGEPQGADFPATGAGDGGDADQHADVAGHRERPNDRIRPPG